MVEGWTTISIPEEIYEKAKKYYIKHQQELKVKHGVRSLTAFFNFCLREYFKKLGII